MRECYDVHLLIQARMWRVLLQCIRALKKADDKLQSITEAEATMNEFLAVCKRAEKAAGGIGIVRTTK
jgi:hypothetical protein